MISIIIPTLNEEDCLEKTLRHTLSLPGSFEVIVVDGGSEDETMIIAKRFEKVRVHASNKGRAQQMNHGARLAKGNILLFLHADTFLPSNTYALILNQLQKENFIGGSFKLTFDKNHPVLKFYTWFSQFSYEFFTYGDHCIFIKSSVFREISGFADIPFMEDVEIQKRIRKKGKFKKLNAEVKTSARRFESIGTFKQMTLDVILVFLFRLGVSPRRLKKFYSDHIR